MQMNFSKSVAALFVSVLSAAVASAHPGHAPTDVVAEVSQPLAGADHFVAFVALTAVLLLTLWLVVKARQAKQSARMTAQRHRNRSSH